MDRLNAAIFALAALAIAYFLLPRRGPDASAMRGFAIWALCVWPVFYMENMLAILAIALAAALMLAPIDRVRRTALFIAVVPCLPVYLAAQVPFPGINFLLWLTPYKIFVAALLLPVMFYPRGADEGAGEWSIGKISLILFAVYTSLIVSLGVNATSGLRFLADQWLLLVIPLLVFSRVASSLDNVDACLKAFLQASLILAAIALIATFKQWDFYRLNEPASVFTEPDTRGGFLRIAATVNTHSLGYHLATCLILLQYFARRIGLGGVRLLVIRAALLAGLLATGSRGALAGLVIGYAASYLLLIERAAVRRGSFVALGVLVLAATGWLLVGDNSDVDPYGTFDYRKQLLLAALNHMSAHPWVGDFQFLEALDFAGLVQGQGIVDITNLYLQIGLQYGLIGVALFMTLIVSTLVSLLRAAAGNGGDADQDARDVRRLCATLAGALIGWLVLVATTSNVGVTVHIGILLAGLGQGILAMRRVPRANVSAPASRPDQALQLQ